MPKKSSVLEEGNGAWFVRTVTGVAVEPNGPMTLLSASCHIQAVQPFSGNGTRKFIVFCGLISQFHDWHWNLRAIKDFSQTLS
jgi:hypothetical protein